jgi:hypothetical protein
MLRKLLSNGFEVLALLVMLALAATTPAQASQLFAFNYSLPGTGLTPMAISASGFFATTDLSGGSYSVTGVWGTWNGLAITGIAAPGGFGSNDNLLFPSLPLVDGNGLGFTVNGAGDDGLGDVNLYYTGTGYTEFSSNVGVGSGFSITRFSLTSVTRSRGLARLLCPFLRVALLRPFRRMPILISPAPFQVTGTA